MKDKREPSGSDFLSLKQLCETLSISSATGRNWLKLGKITPQYTDKKNVFFTKKYVRELKKEIQSGTNAVLRSRRNKKYISGTALYRSYVGERSANVSVVERLLEELIEKNIKVTPQIQQLLLAECALQLFLSQKSGSVSHGGCLKKYIENELQECHYFALVDDLIGEREKALQWMEAYPSFFSYKYVCEVGEDILGLLYLSSKNIGNRKAKGSYYTPTKVVRQVMEKLCLDEEVLADKKLLDPCCGTGNFLLQLPEGCKIENIYAKDIDVVSIKITRINLALKYHPKDIEVLYQNITKSNYLSGGAREKFDYILGNPPWGYHFSEEEKDKLRKKFSTAVGKNIESYDVFLEKALQQLRENGKLSFVLPEAILNVKAHRPIRENMAEKTSIEYLSFLGNAFDQVQCPSIILQLKHTGKPMDCRGMWVKDGTREFQILHSRKVDIECFSFRMTDEEQQLLEKIVEQEHCVFLKNHAMFAMGIVTGDNRTYISKVKTAENETVLKGSDLYKFKIVEPERYILFQPERFQQAAAEACYRAPERLLYRFISNKLVFAYDDRQRVSLNSCNILIPKLEDMSIKYVMTILNSRVAQFVFQKQFHAVKVLKSHIEKIPIPVLEPQKQKKYEKYADLLQEETDEKKIWSIYEELDQKIAELFRLTPVEYEMIKKAVGTENLFLH